jgi:hypothetical protein
MSLTRRRSVARGAVAAALGLAAGAPWLVVGAGAAAATPGSASLGGHCTTMAGAGSAQCRRSPAPATPMSGPRAVAARDPSQAIGFADFAAGYSIYRLVSATEDQRRCRLQPTCSLFAARAARRFGLLRGLLMGLARAQMAHTDQDGLLPRAVASDGKFIYLDPVDRWIHGAL